MSVLLIASVLTSCCGFMYAFVFMLDTYSSSDINSMESFGRLI